MKIENKQKRIDSDSGYLVLCPEEFRKLKQTLNESDGFDILAMYEDLKGRLVSEKRHIAKVVDLMTHTGGDMLALLGEMPEFCKHVGKTVGRLFGRENIAFIDNGTFKVCAVFKNGYALKIGLLEGGLATEIANSLKFPDLTCFPKLIGYDETKNTCIVEAVNPEFGEPTCREFYGIERHKVVSLLAGEKPECREDEIFLKNMESRKGPEWDSMRDLRKFFRQERVLYDIAYGNWGLAMRNGHVVPVILDYDI